MEFVFGQHRILGQLVRGCLAVKQELPSDELPILQSEKLFSWKLTEIHLDSESTIQFIHAREPLRN